MRGALFLWLLLVGTVPAAQNAWPVSPEQRAHVAMVRSERTAALHAAWETAGEERRARAVQWLVEARREGVPDGALPELTSLAAATRILRGGDGGLDLDDPLQRFADALDLQVVPGEFAPAETGRGEALTVRVYRLGRGAIDENVLTRLFWIAPDGTEILARREPIGPARFETPGFGMFIRAPLAEAGWWRLVPELTIGERTARGVAVEVECRVPPFALEPTEAEEHAQLLELGLRFAHRTSRSLDAPHRLPDPAWRPRREPPAPFAELAMEGARYLDGSGTGEARELILVPVVDGEAAASLFLGPAGKKWLELAREREALVISIGTGIASREAIGAFHALLEKAYAAGFAAEKTVLVARGRGVASVPFLFVGRALEMGGVVLATERAGVPPVLARYSTLLVRGEPNDGETPASHVVTVVDPLPLVVRELTLPERIGAWLESR